MATSNSEVRNAVLETQTDGIRLDHLNGRTLWRPPFLSSNFQTNMTHHYWAIDALDECSNTSAWFGAILPEINEPN